MDANAYSSSHNVSTILFARDNGVCTNTLHTLFGISIRHDD